MAILLRIANWMLDRAIDVAESVARIGDKISSYGEYKYCPYTGNTAHETERVSMGNGRFKTECLTCNQEWEAQRQATGW